MLTRRKRLSIFSLTLVAAALSACQTATQPTSTPGATPMPASSPGQTPAQSPGQTPAQPGQPSTTPGTIPGATPLPGTTPGTSPASPQTPVAGLARLELNADSRFLSARGASVQLRLTGFDAAGQPLDLSGRTIDWRSLRPADLGVDAQGRVTALVDGGYSEIVASLGGQEARILISVADEQAGSGSGGGGGGGGGGSTPRATLAGVSPATAAIGETILLSGSDLNQVDEVLIDGIPASFSLSGRSLSVQVPAGASAGKITISPARSGQSATVTISNRVWYVDDSTDGDGSSWEQAFATLQQALSAASAADEIWVAAGTYKPHASDATAFFMVPAGYKVYGSFNGDERYASERELEDLSGHESILSGDLSGNDSYASWPFTGMSENSLNVLRHGDGALLDGLVIEGGNADSTFDLSSPRGAGIYSGANALTLRHSVLRHNIAADRGAAWYNISGAASLSDVSFWQNEAAGGGGGAIYNESAALSFEGVDFVDNRGNGGGGGAIYNETGPLTLSASSFSLNQANGSGGGGIRNRSGNLSLTGVRFEQNQGNGAGGSGILTLGGSLMLAQTDFLANTHSLGTLNVQSASVTISDGSFVDNIATAPGGAIYASTKLLTIDGTRFSQNETSAPGGAISASTSLLEIRDAEFSDNSAGSAPGGAISVSGGQLLISGSEFTDNETSAPGGAISASGLDTAEISDSDFTGNHSEAPGGAIQVSANSITLANSNFTGNTSPAPGGGASLGASADISISGSSFDQNESTDSPGGALNLSSVNLLIEDSSFSQNDAFAPGGALNFSVSGTATLNRSRFVGNRSLDSVGGAINSSQPTLALTDVHFESNQADGPGGALYTSSGTGATMTRVSFIDNHSGSTGGGLSYSGGQLTVDQGAWIGNSSVDPGGALYASSPVTMQNVVVNQNSATGISSGLGGGIYSSGALSLSHASFGENSASGYGQAIYANSTLALRNSIVWDNDVTPIYLSGQLTSSYSIIRNLSSYTLAGGSTGNLDEVPEFTSTNALGNDRRPFTADDGLRLQADSPALDLDNSGSVPVMLDILGLGRNGNPDAGAYERQ